MLYDAPDPYTRRVIIDRGQVKGVALGSPVIDEAGVLGQVTRVDPLLAEVTLLAAVLVLLLGHPLDGDVLLAQGKPAEARSAASWSKFGPASMPSLSMSVKMMWRTPMDSMRSANAM